MSENHKNDMINEETSDETKVLPLAEIDAQMKDAYKLLNKQKNEKASDEHVAVEENENAEKDPEASVRQDEQSETNDEQDQSSTVIEHDEKREEVSIESTEEANIGSEAEETNADSEAASIDEASEQTVVNEQESTVSEEDKQPITLEEKRRKERASKMTIEERRKLQRENPKSLEKESKLIQYFRQCGGVDYGFLVLLVVSELLNLYLSFQIMRYFKVTAAIFCFVIVTLLLTGCLLLTVKKRNYGFICNGILSLILLLGSVAAYRGARFSNKVFDNTESETVMIVAKKDASIKASDDFNNKKFATVKFEPEINEFAETLLDEKGKQGYLTQEFSSYQDAYNSLMNGKSDIMVYTLQMEQRLEESDLYSKDQIKVLFEQKRERKAVESKAVDITKDPFNVLVSGVDLTSKNINEKGSSDVNILVTVNPKTKKMIMQTIPRDSWAPLTCVNDQHTKLTYAGAYGGIDCSIHTIEKMYDITINYYLKINFQGVMDLVDALGGITVNNNIAFCTPYKDRYEVERETCFHVGENRIDGAQALIYSRVRKLFTDGDIERGRHQMEVINGVVREFKQSPSMGTINSLLGAVENNFTTNLSESDIVDAFQLFMLMKDSVDDITSYTMEGEMLWNNDEITNEYLYYFYPKDDQMQLVKDRIDEVMNGK